MSVRRVGALVVGLIGGVAVATTAPALDVEVVAVRATESGPSDPELQAMRPRLRRLVGYRAFRVVDRHRRRCAWRNSQTFELPGGRWLHLMPKGRDDESVVMQVRLLDGRRRLVDTQLRLQNRGTMLFGVGRDDPGADSALIIMLKAEDP